jgi:hypothetical protein
MTLESTSDREGGHFVSPESISGTPSPGRHSPFGPLATASRRLTLKEHLIASATDLA